MKQTARSITNKSPGASFMDWPNLFSSRDLVHSGFTRYDILFGGYDGGSQFQSQAAQACWAPCDQGLLFDLDLTQESNITFIFQIRSWRSLSIVR